MSDVLEQIKQMRQRVTSASTNGVSDFVGPPALGAQDEMVSPLLSELSAIRSRVSSAPVQKQEPYKPTRSDYENWGIQPPESMRTSGDETIGGGTYVDPRETEGFSTREDFISDQFNTKVVKPMGEMASIYKFEENKPDRKMPKKAEKFIDDFVKANQGYDRGAVRQSAERVWNGYKFATQMVREEQPFKGDAVERGLTARKWASRVSDEDMPAFLAALADVANRQGANKDTSTVGRVYRGLKSGTREMLNSPEGIYQMFTDDPDEQRRAAQIEAVLNSEDPSYGRGGGAASFLAQAAEMAGPIALSGVASKIVGGAVGATKAARAAKYGKNLANLAGRFTGGATFTPMFVTQSYEGYRRDGIEPGRAKIAAVFSGILQGAIETAELGLLTTNPLKGVAGKTAIEVLGRAVKNHGLRTLTELLEEGPQGFVDSFAGYLASDSKTPVPQAIVESVATGVDQTIAAIGPMLFLGGPGALRTVGLSLDSYSKQRMSEELNKEVGGFLSAAAKNPVVVDSLVKSDPNIAETIASSDNPSSRATIKKVSPTLAQALPDLASRENFVKQVEDTFAGKAERIRREYEKKYKNKKTRERKLEQDPEYTSALRQAMDYYTKPVQYQDAMLEFDEDASIGDQWRRIKGHRSKWRADGEVELRRDAAKIAEEESRELVETESRPSDDEAGAMAALDDDAAEVMAHPNMATASQTLRETIKRIAKTIGQSSPDVANRDNISNQAEKKITEGAREYVEKHARLNESIDDAYRELGGIIGGEVRTNLDPRIIKPVARLVSAYTQKGITKFSDATLEMAKAVPAFIRRPDVQEAIKAEWNKLRSINADMDEPSDINKILGEVKDDPQYQPVGDPRLANPGESPEARQLMDVLDERRKQGSDFNSKSVEQWTASGKAMAHQNPEIIRQEVISRNKTNESFVSPEQVVAAEEVFNRDADAAIQSGDPLAIDKVDRFANAMRNVRGVGGQVLRAMRDKFESPAQRRAYRIREELFQRPPKLDKKLSKIEEKNPNAADEHEQFIQQTKEASQSTFNEAGLGEVVADPQKAAADMERLTREAVLRPKGIKKAIESYTETHVDPQRVVEQAKRRARNSRKGEVKPKEPDATRAMKHLRENVRKILGKNAQKIKSNKYSKVAEELRSNLEAIKIEINGATGIDLNDPVAIEKIAGSRVASAAVGRILGPNNAFTSDKLFEYYNNAILSGPLTQEVNTLSAAPNFARIMLAEGMVATVAGLARLIPKFKNSEKINGLASWRDIGEMVSHFQNDERKLFARAFQRALDSWVTETPFFENEVTETEGGETKFEVPNISIAGKKGRAIRAIGWRPLLFADEFNKSWMTEMLAPLEASRIAREGGIEGPARREFIKMQLDDVHSESYHIALKVAKEALFQEKGGELREKIKTRAKTVRNWYGLRYVMPFVNVPVNIFAQGLRMTPANAPFMLNDFIKGDIRSGSKRAAEQLIGVGTILAMGQLDSDPDDPFIVGSILPNQTDDPEKNRAQQYRTRRPYTMKVAPGVYLSYQRAEPFALGFGLMADIKTRIIEDIKTKGWKRALNLARIPMQDFGSQLQDKTFLKGIGDLVEAMSSVKSGDPGVLGRWASNFAVGWVPNLYRQPMSKMRDTVPNRRVWGKALSSDRVLLQLKRMAQKTELFQPFGMLEDEPYYDRWGNPSKSGGPGYSPLTDMLYRVLVPAEYRKVAPELGDRVIMNWNEKVGPEDRILPSVPSNTFQVPGEKQRRYMTPKQFAEFTKLSGQVAKALVIQSQPDADNPTEVDLMKVEKSIEMADDIARKLIVAEFLATQHPEMFPNGQQSINQYRESIENMTVGKPK